MKPAVIAGVAAIALTGGATQVGAAGTSATAIKETTSTVDRAWNKKSDRIQERYSVRTRVASGRATLTDRRGNRLGVSIAGLRRGADTRTFGRTTLFTNGLGKGVDAAVQRTDAGVRMMSVIRTASAPTSYRYPMALPRGAKLDRQASGALLIRNALGNPIGVVRRPWAFDASGTRVTTSFAVRVPHARAARRAPRCRLSGRRQPQHRLRPDERDAHAQPPGPAHHPVHRRRYRRLCDRRAAVLWLRSGRGGVCHRRGRPRHPRCSRRSRSTV